MPRAARSGRQQPVNSLGHDARLNRLPHELSYPARIALVLAPADKQHFHRVPLVPKHVGKGNAVELAGLEIHARHKYAYAGVCFESDEGPQRIIETDRFMAFSADDGKKRLADVRFMMNDKYRRRHWSPLFAIPAQRIGPGWAPLIHVK